MMLFRYLWSGFIVMFGIYLNAYGQNQKSIENYLRSLRHRILVRFRHKRPNHRDPEEIV